MMKVAVLFGLLLALAVPSHALFFKVREGNKRCFLEEVPRDILVVGTYKNPDTIHLKGENPIKVNVHDPSGGEVLTHRCTSDGRFAFTSTMGGEHLICFAADGNQWGAREFRVHLALQVGEEATDYEELAKTEHLSAIEVEIRKLSDKVNFIRAEQKYQKASEERFQEESDAMSSNIMWWSLAQTVVLAAAGIYQVFRLKKFFHSKKLA